MGLIGLYPRPRRASLLRTFKMGFPVERSGLTSKRSNDPSVLISRYAFDFFLGGLIAQKIRELFAICGVQSSEELRKSLTTHAVGHRERASTKS